MHVQQAKTFLNLFCLVNLPESSEIIALHEIKFRSSWCNFNQVLGSVFIPRLTGKKLSKWIYAQKIFHFTNIRITFEAFSCKVEDWLQATLWMVFSMVKGRSDSICRFIKYLWRLYELGDMCLWPRRQIVWFSLEWIHFWSWIKLCLIHEIRWENSQELLPNFNWICEKKIDFQCHPIATFCNNLNGSWINNK